MARELYSRSAAAAAAAEPIAPILCPKHADYRDADGPAWPDDPNIGLQEGDEAELMKLKSELQLGHASQVLRSEKRGGPLQRAVLAYKMLPQSYKNKLWRKAADDLIATRHDNLLVPDSEFINPGMKPMWDGMYCQAMCPDNLVDNKLCPWKDDCDTFYNNRKPRWDRQKETSEICHTRWLVEEERRRGEGVSDKRRVTLQLKKELLKERLRVEKILAKQLFKPTTFEHSDEIVGTIRKFIIRANEAPPDLKALRSVMSHFPISQPVLTLLDFQCLIADYFHDGLPGFRITSKADPKISGIRVHDSKMIRIGKESHQAFMHQFIRNMMANPYPRIQPVIAGLTDAQRMLQNVPNGTPATAALQEWRESIGLQGRIEDSIKPHLASRLPIEYRIPLDDYGNVKRFSINEVVSAGDPIIPYHSYLESGQRHLTLFIKKGEIGTLTQDETRILLRFLLLVLFGPSYEKQLSANPVMFTFDAHKGHMNRILSQSMLQNVHRLVTPYNIADSAMTERFAVIDPDEEYLVSEIAQEEEDEDEDEEEDEEADMQEDAAEKNRKAKDVAERNRKAKEEAEINEDEKEDEDDEYPAAQQGSTRFMFSTQTTSRLVISDTNTMFDNNWLIYYKNMGFTQHTPLLFSMNLVDAGLHQFITRSKIDIPSSLYTVEAPFDNGITRGPSLNYLMLGLMRGKNSNVFSREFDTKEQLYEELCRMHPHITEDRFVEKLLPIYTIPASPQSLPLFQHIASAPLFAYHMMYDLQHNISALPSRIKWAGDREQYIAISRKMHCAFVTLDTTAHLCSLANEVASLLERKTHIKLVGATETPAELADVKEKARIALIEKEKRQSQFVLQKGKRASEQTSTSRKLAKPAPPITLSSTSYTEGNANMGVSKTKSKRKGGKRGGAHGNHTRKKSLQEHPDIVLDREYFFLNWLYPLTIFVNGAFHKHHAEHAYVLLQDLQKDLSSPFLFSSLREQLIYAVSQIPNVPKKLLMYVKEITADTYESVAPQCASLLTSLYTRPSSIFSDPIRAKTLIEQLVQMKYRLLRRYHYRDSTANLLHILLDQSNQETACLVLSLLFERLHGRIQNGTSYLGQILGITGGPALKRVDDQEAWEYLTTVMEEDMKRIADLAAPAAPPKTAIPQKARNVSAKLGHVVRRSDIRKLKRGLTHYRPKNGHHASRAPTRAPDHPSRAPTRQGLASHVTPITKHAPQVAMGGSMKTRRAKKGSRRHRKD